MRSWINLIESPIANIELFGDVNDSKVPFDPSERAEKLSGSLRTVNTGFSDVDSKLLQSPKAIAKIIRAFKNTPFVFEIFFVNSEIADGNDELHNDFVDDYASTYSGVYRNYGIIKGKAGVIRVVLLSNLSPHEAKMPMTAWTLAHKIGHSIQDGLAKDSAKYGFVGKQVIACLARIEKIAIRFCDSKSVGFDPLDQRFPPNFKNAFTMKSARDNVLFNVFEEFAELVAQFLIKGKIILGDRPPKDEYTNKGSAKMFEDMLNAEMAKLFDLFVGKVMVEV